MLRFWLEEQTTAIFKFFDIFEVSFTSRIYKFNTRKSSPLLR